MGNLKPETVDEYEYLTLSQAAEIAAVSVRTIQRMIERGELPSYRISERGIRVRIDDIRALFKAN